jgi:hypothetical protein
LWLLTTDRRRATILPACVLLLASCVLPGAWMARNAAVGNGLRLSSVSSMTNLFYAGGYTEITARGGDTLLDWPDEVHRLAIQLESQASPGEDIFRTMDRLTLATIKAHPAAYAKAGGLSVFKFFTDHSMGSLYARLGWDYHPPGLRAQILSGHLSAPSQELCTGFIGLAWMVFNALLAVLMGVGLMRLALTGRGNVALLLGGVMLYFVITTQLNGLERFRLPVMGLEAIAAAAAFSRSREPHRADLTSAAPTLH